MSYNLKIFDFHLFHKATEGNTSYAELAMKHPELVNYITVNKQLTKSVQRQVIFDSFRVKFSNDLNSERLKHLPSKKIIKKSKVYNRGEVTPVEIQRDYSNKVLFGVLHAGRITDNAILESPSEEEDNYEYALLNGDRIYDDFFFMIHLSFKANVARLFIINGGNNTNVDAILKRYFRSDMFKAPDFKSTKATDFIPPEYRSEVLGRATVNSVTISKTDTVISQSDGIEYDVEIRLKPKSTNAFSRLSQQAISKLRKSKVILEESSADDENSGLKFSIKDPNTNKTKTISYGSEDDFLPHIVLTDEEVFNSNGRIDVQGLKQICMEYIVYEGDVLK